MTKCLQKLLVSLAYSEWSWFPDILEFYGLIHKKLATYSIMSMLTRPSVVFAIVFGCFAVLIPRVFVPLFRPRQSAPVHQQHDRKSFPINRSKYHRWLSTDFRRPSPPPTESIPRNDNNDNREHASVRTRYRLQEKKTD